MRKIICDNCGKEIAPPQARFEATIDNYYTTDKFTPYQKVASWKMDICVDCFRSMFSTIPMDVMQNE